ncbi:hypothetical protein LZ759_10090 [Xylella fastidiosa subsp. multiplex]|nr:hypothetical protein [Xylella fastidiosa]UIT41085.1 hypothetical protein LZ759_10090 [Xylella fastidiosa subsp. multiplex]
MPPHPAVLTNRGIIDNLGTGNFYGDHLALQAQALTHRDETIDGQTHTAVIATHQRMDIRVATLRNTTNAFIISDGNAAIDIIGALNLTAVRLTPPELDLPY